MLKSIVTLAGLKIATRATGEEIQLPPSAEVRFLTPEQIRHPGDSDWQMLQRLADKLGGGTGARIDHDYVIDRQIEIVGKSGFSIVGNGRIMVDSGVPPTYGHSVFYFASCSDFVIEGLTCDGNRANRMTAEAPGHLMVLDACHKWTLRRVRAVNGTTDGFLVCTTVGQGTGEDRRVVLADIPSDWVMQDCEAINNFRQGLTIAESLNWKVSGGLYAQTKGLWDVPGASGPCAGIDLEPDHVSAYPRDRLRFGVIEHVTFSGNQGPGLLISSTDGVSDVLVNQCRFLDNGKSAIECSARNVRIVSPEIRGWDATPYSKRRDVPEKRGLIDIGAGAGPDIEVVAPRFFDIRMAPDSPLPLVYVHGNAKHGLRIRQMTTDGSPLVIAHLLATGSTFEDSDIGITKRGRFAAFTIAGTNVRFRNNSVRIAAGNVIDCSSKRPQFVGNTIQVRASERGQAVIDCSRGQGGDFIGNSIVHINPGYGLDLKVSRGATVTGNTSHNNRSEQWIDAPLPCVMKANRRVPR